MQADAPDEETSALEREELTRIARASGARVLQTNVVDVNGVKTSVIELDIPGNAKAIVFLNGVARHDAHHPTIRTIGLTLRRAHPEPADFGAALMAFVKANVDFVMEADEVFQHALYSLEVGAGDCDDHARCVCALAIAGGFLRSRVVGVPGADGKVAHVCAQLSTGPGAWAWLETTVDAHYGEPPFDAARRLGLMKARTDIVGGA